MTKVFILFGLVAGWAFGAIECDCDPLRPETLEARQCSLCKEAEKQPAGAQVFFVKDISPRKPNRWLALPRMHRPTLHRIEEMSAAERTNLWEQAIAKAKDLWGDSWGVAYNGDQVRQQCHTHIHIGKLMPGIETSQFVVVDGPADIPARPGEGVWIHPAGRKLHVHLHEQITETALMR